MTSQPSHQMSHPYKGRGEGSRVQPKGRGRARSKGREKWVVKWAEVTLLDSLSQSLPPGLAPSFGSQATHLFPPELPGQDHISHRVFNTNTRDQASRMNRRVAF